jgi:hypothetical protein
MNLCFIFGLRFILLPFPLTLLLSAALLSGVDHLAHPDRSHIVHDGPGEAIGGLAIFIAMIGTQILMGIPSLIVLDSIQGRWKAYAITGSTMAVLLSFMMGAVLHAPQFGETLAWMFSMVFLFFGIPLIVSYLAAFAIKLLIHHPSLRQKGLNSLLKDHPLP